MKNELLFEIGTEEIPAAFIMPAMNDLQKILGNKLNDLALSYGTLKGAATPRRIAVCVTGLEERQPDRKSEVFGPPKKAAFDQDNNPTKAALGFAKTNGVEVADLKIVSTPKGEYVMVEKEEKGRLTKELLPAVLPEVISTLSFPKSMRWGSGSLSFVRPIQWITAIFNGEVVSFSSGTMSCGITTRGHRIMAPESFEVTDFSNYIEGLRNASVLADPDERKKTVISQVNDAAKTVGGRALEDEGLIDIVTNLVEKPHAVCGTFEKRFLELPRDVLITSMREHQKYFAVVDESGSLMPHFIAINNTDVKSAAIAAEGHQRVLRARLEDAMFFFKEDQQKKLADRVADLSGIIFQAKLGTLLEKNERVVALTAKLAAKLAPAKADLSTRAALLCKTDLLTAMVNEFPSLQGIMGRDYAIIDGEGAEVAAAIQDHYKPVRAGGEVPEGIPGALVGMADRIDTIAGCFGIGQLPTGTTDPFGLRRQSLGLIHTIEKHGFSLSLEWLIDEALNQYGEKLTIPAANARKQIHEFIRGRFVNDLVSKGIPADALDAATTVSFDDIVDCRRRTDALVDISRHDTFTLLAGAFKRVVNIIKDNTNTEVNENLLAEDSEKKLFAAFVEVKTAVTPLLDKRQYGEALTEILRMKEPVDAFFDDVMVMVEDADVRENRLALLTAISKLFLRIGDFSRMHSLNQENHNA